MNQYLTDEDYKTAKANGISQKLAYSRFYTDGWSKTDAITIPAGGTFLWRKYKDQCQMNGIKQNCFYKRIRKGMDPEQAATKPSTPRSLRPTPNPKLPADVIAQAATNGIGRNTLIYRVYHLEWTVEKAVNTPPMVRKRKAH